MEGGLGSTMTPHRPSPPSSASPSTLYDSPRSNISIYRAVRPTPPPRQSPRSFSSPRPISLDNPSSIGKQQQQLKRPHPQNAFRSSRLQSEIAQIEQRLSSRAPEMTIEDALLHLRRILPSIDNSSLTDVDADRVLNGLAAACWKSVTRSASTSSTASARRQEGSIADSFFEAERVPYSQLLRGTETAIRERLAVRSDLLAQLHAAAARTRELPRAISNRERDIEAATAAFVARTARALRCPEGSDKDAAATSSPPKLSSPSPLGSALGTEVHGRLVELRRRRELRAWACGELRGALNDLATNASDLKKQIAVVVNAVKTEEAATKQKAAQIEHLNALLAAQSSRIANSANATPASDTMTNTIDASAPPFAYSPRRRTSVSFSPTSAGISSPPRLIAPTVPSTPTERLICAQERHAQLLEGIEAKRAAVRARTEQVFDVRRVTRELENETSTERAAIEALSAQIEHMERAYTPRPDWHELQSTTVVTTAVDRAGRRAKLRRRKRSGVNSSPTSTRGSGANGSGGGDDDDETSEQRVQEILASHWSTVDKVSAMSDELALIRTRNHSGNAISAEQAKLDRLQREIAKTLLQLESARARAAAT